MTLVVSCSKDKAVKWCWLESAAFFGSIGTLSDCGFIFLCYLGVKFHFVNPSEEELHLYLAPEFNLGNLGKATWSQQQHRYIFKQKSHLSEPSHTGPTSSILCMCVCVSLCSTVTLQCVCVFFAWNGGLKGNHSDSSIWVQHSSLIMSHRALRGGGNPSALQNMTKPPSFEWCRSRSLNSEGMCVCVWVCVCALLL